MRLPMATKRQLIERKKDAYRKASKKERTRILNGLEDSTGLTREHLSRALRDKYIYETKAIKTGRGRKPIYGLAHKEGLVKVWTILGFPSSRRLVGGLADTLDNLERFNEYVMDPEVKRQLLRISHTTVDRLLKFDRLKLYPFGKATTKPGTLLKNEIPIRRGTDWDDVRPGYMEIDLVAHCGHNTRGEFLFTLDCTDVSTGWTECRAVINKARIHTLNAIKQIREQIPFPLLAIDSDNGSEFINDHFLYFCRDENIYFTRSRPNKSNDSCYVEQKNWSIVRHEMGYDRFAGEDALHLFNRYYLLLSKLNNYFVPSQKLVERQRTGATVRKKHDRAQTPYRRLLANPYVSEETINQLNQTFYSINVVQLRKEMTSILAQIEKHSLGYDGKRFNRRLH